MTKNKSSVAIQFFKGVDESVVPEIRLTRNRDGKNGQAIFSFDSPDALSSENFKDIQGMYLLDQEGELSTREVNIRLSNGKKTGIEAIYSWKAEVDFERFMRFAQRYAKINDLGYQSS